MRHFILAGVAAAALAASLSPASAFTLADAPALARSAAAPIDRVWYDQWGNWHPNHPWRWRRPVEDPDANGWNGGRQCWSVGKAGAVYCRPND
jgi:hypothetical protein